MTKPDNPQQETEVAATLRTEADPEPPATSTLQPQAPPVKLETVSELCSNCGSFVTVQIAPATADDDDTVFFKCTGCGGQLSYVVEKPKVEPELKVEIKDAVKTAKSGVITN